MAKSLSEFFSKPPESRRYYPFLGVFEREVRRFFNVPAQTIAGPIGSSLLYFTLFNFSIGRMASQSSTLFHGVDYITFLIPGVVAMEAVNSSFQNPVSSLLGAKWSGTIIDQLMAPLSTTAVWSAYIAGAFIRALLVGFSAYVAGVIFTQHFFMHNFFLVLFAFGITTVCFGSIGIIAGFLCKTFDQVGMIGSFVMQPLVFLSGVFFSFQELPSHLTWLPYVNPVFYVVNLFRFGFIGVSDIGPEVSVPASAACALVLAAVSLRYLKLATGLRT